MGRGVAIILCACALGSAPLLAEQTVGPMAKRAVVSAGIRDGAATEEKLRRALTLINVDNFVHEKEAPPKEDGPPPLPKGGTHPYEWDSLRDAEAMLGDRNGGSCGTHGLALAAMLRASGVAADDLRVLGAVEATDYSQICPGAAGEKRQRSWQLDDDKGQKYKTTEHPASGHVFLLVRLGKQWQLVNTTHDPFQFPRSRNSVAMTRFQEAAKRCPEGDRACVDRARRSAAPHLALEDFEMAPYLAPEKLDLSGKGPPVVLPLRPFPSLTAWMGEGRAKDALTPPMIAFQSWRFEEYPRHTIQGRLDLVASGRVGDGACRWSGAAVARAVRPPGAPPSRPAPAHD